MKVVGVLFYVFVAGVLGGLTDSLVMWPLGTMGITPALGFSMAPEMTFE